MVKATVPLVNNILLAEKKAISPLLIFPHLFPLILFLPGVTPYIGA